MADFKYGERVQLLPESGISGKVGVVAAGPYWAKRNDRLLGPLSQRNNYYDTSAPYYKVRVEKIGEVLVWYDWIKVAPPEPKFKNGDNVYITENIVHGTPPSFRKGVVERALPTELNGHSTYVYEVLDLIDLDNDSSERVYEGYLTPLNESEKEIERQQDEMTAKKAKGKSPEAVKAAKRLADKAAEAPLRKAIGKKESTVKKLRKMFLGTSGRTKEGKGMFNIKDQLFQKVDYCVYDLRNQRIGVKKNDGESYAVYVPGKDGKKPKIENCIAEMFSISVPAFAMRTKLDELKSGDVVLLPCDDEDANQVIFYTSHKAGEDVENPTINGIDTENGSRTQHTLPSNPVLPNDSVLAVKNLFGDGLDVGNMLPMLLLMKGDDGDEEGEEQLSKTLLLLHFLKGSGDGKGADMNSMLPFFLMSKGKNKGNLTQLLMMQQMGGVSGGMASLLPMMLMGEM